MRRVAIAVTVLCAGCVAQARPFQPARVTTGAKAPALYKAAVRALVERGEAAETADQAAGVVIGAYQESEKLGTRYRLRWRIAVDDGAVKVDSDCQWFNKDPLSGSGDWKQCDTQPEGRDREAQMIALDVQQAAEREPAQQPAVPAPQPAPAGVQPTADNGAAPPDVE